MESSHRTEKIESLMRDILAELIERDFCTSRETLISLTRIKISGNQQEARVYVSVLPDLGRERVVAALEREVVFFQHILNKKLRMRPVPKIIFVADAQPAQAQQVETILEELKDSGKY